MSELDEINRITEAIIGVAIQVHRTLGPGLLESAYEACVTYDLSELGYKVLHQVPLSLIYKKVKLDCAYRLDLFVEDKVIL